MKLSFVVTLFLAFSLTLMSNNVYSWGQTGHRVIGQIAYNHLTDNARTQVLALLSGDKLPEVTTWADEQRSNPDDFWQKKSSKWHYINANEKRLKQLASLPIPFKQEPTDIYTAILKNITVLQDTNSSAEQKEFHLRFLTHLVGDLHMPLHVGRSEDRGGNLIDVKFFHRFTNLHRLWDSGLIDNQKLSYTEFTDFIDTNDQTYIEQTLSTPIHDWIYESYEMTNEIYKIGNGEFGYNYQYEHLPLVKQRLLQGGIRLAGILNKIFDPAAKAGSKAIKTFQ